MSSPGSDAQRRFLSASDQPTRDDDSHNASLSTTPTQSHMQPPKSNPSSASKPAGSTLKPNTTLRPPLPHDTPAARQRQPSSSSYSTNTDRQGSTYDDSNSSIAGRGQTNVSLCFNLLRVSNIQLTFLCTCYVCTTAVLVTYAPNAPRSRQARLSQSALCLLRYIRHRDALSNVRIRIQLRRRGRS